MNTTNTYTDHAAAVTAKLIAAINAGTGQWRAPWHHNGTADGAHIWAPINATTRHPYRGGNLIGLALEAATAEYPTGEWATYKQWATLGAQVRKGETGTRCLRWIQLDTDPADSADTDRSRLRMIPKTFVVFNAAQVDGNTYAPTPDGAARLDTADADIAATGAVIVHGGDRAFYRPTADVIQLPDRHRFTSTAGYYATALHELVHWTGHPSRLARDFACHGTHAYAIEELTAELGAALLTARYGIGNEARGDHAAYLAHWLEVLSNDPTVLLTTATKAQAAADLIVAANSGGEE